MAHLFSTPIDIEPLPVEGTVLVSDTSTPPPHDICIDCVTSITNFGDSDEGGCNYTALNCFKALLQHGFHTPDNPRPNSWSPSTRASGSPMALTPHPAPSTTSTARSSTSSALSPKSATPSMTFSTDTRNLRTTGLHASAASNSVANPSTVPPTSLSL